MTDAQYLAWLQDPSAIRTVLIEATAQVAGAETTIYMATAGYNTAPSDVPANVHYRPIASVGVLFTEQLSLTGDGALSAGDLEIANYGGEHDEWLTWIWTNRPLKAYIGDVRWPRADFRPIFDGIIADIGTSGREKLLLRLRDKLQRLNGAITETKLGGATPNSDALIPVAFGEVHNVTPLLIDPANLRYQIHDGQVAAIFEVRDNGVPVTVSVDNASGTFALQYAPAGAVTVSAKGDSPGGAYGSTVAQLVQRLVTGYGKAIDRFTAADIDAANFAAFDAAHSQPVGYYATDRTNVLVACQALAGSIGAQLSMTRLGQLRLVQIARPAGSPVLTVRPSQIVERSLAPTQRTDPVAAVKLGFNKNWTVQQGLVTAIPEQHKNLFATEWLTSTSLDTGAQAAYRLNGEPEQQDTMLLRRVDADAEAQRRVDLWKAPRMAYEFEGLPELLTLELGQVITVVHPRFGMADGVDGMVISLAPDWGTCRVKVGFIVLPPAGSAAAVPPVGAIANDRDVLLQGVDTRFDSSGRGPLLTPSAATIKVAADGTLTPATVTFSVLQIGVTGPVTWEITGGILSGTDSNSRTLDASTVTQDVVTVTASIAAADGHTYSRECTVSRVHDGANGANGVTTYTWIKYANDAAGGGLSDDPTGKTYIGLAYNKTTPVESTNPADYTWSLIKGTDGVPGAPGANGQTFYTWIKYSDNADGSGLYDTPTATTAYIGIAVNKTTATESTVNTDYTWSRFKGDQGVPGTSGTNGARGPGHYYATGTAWSDATASAACPAGAPVTNDVVTIADGSTYALTKKWSGTAWVAMGAVYDGSLFVTGSINSAAINTNNLTIKDASGNVILGAGTKLDWGSWLTNKPTSLSQISAAEASKLAGIAAGATVGATIGSDLAGQMTASNITTYIASAAIGDALIGNLTAGKVTSGTLSGVSLSIAGPSGWLLQAGYMGTTVAYNKLSGYNIDSSNSGGGGNPGAPAINGTSYGGSSAGVAGTNGSGSGAGYVGYGSYSFYSAGGTAGPFTGSHDALLPNDTPFVQGDIVVDQQLAARKDVSNTLFIAAPSSSPRQKNALGVLAADAGPLSANRPTSLVEQYLPGKQVHDDYGDLVSVDQTVYAPEYGQLKDSYRLVLVNALGEGQINVCGENGEIAAGDLIVTSSMPGKGMRQDDDVVRSITVARAREAVTFSDPSEVKQIACIYLAG